MPVHAAERVKALSRFKRFKKLRGPKKSLALKLHEDGIPTPFGRKRFSLKRPGALYPDILRELHYDATHPSRKPSKKGDWHKLQGYPENIVAVHRNNLDFYAMDREGNVYYGVNGRRVRKTDAPDIPRKERPEKLTKILSPNQAEHFLGGRPDYLPPLRDLRNTYATEVDKQLKNVGLKKTKLPREMLARLVPSELHKKALMLERFRFVDHDIRQEPIKVIRSAVESAVQKVEHDYKNRRIRPPGILKKK